MWLHLGAHGILLLFLFLFFSLAMNLEAELADIESDADARMQSLEGPLGIGYCRPRELTRIVLSGNPPTVLLVGGGA